ncbi:MAG: glycosyltransferase involved in cell wall biosynthesis [Polaribacter sp.]|jgi:glycosyltransferase involved in cell wall biosynthesis
MKILFLSHYGAMLGANRSLLALVSGMRQRGVQVMVWCPKEGPFTDALRAKAIPYEVHKYENWAATFLFPSYWKLPFGYLKNKAIFKELVEAVEKVKPDVIHTNSSVLPMGAYLAEALKIPHVWHIREFGRQDYDLRFFPGRRELYTWLAKAERVIVISKAIRKEVIGDHEIPTSLIYNGVARKSHFKKIEDTAMLPRDGSTITFLIIGMLHPTKKQGLALKAFHQVAKEYPDARLLIVGKGRRLYEKKLKNYCVKNDLTDQVIFAGYLAQPDEAYKQSDVVLMCSAQEAMGRVTVEAMAFAKPVIGYNSGATPELITQGEDGFLFEGGEEQLASCMRYFLRHPEDIPVMGHRGFLKASELFTEEAYVENMYRVFGEVLKEG